MFWNNSLRTSFMKRNPIEETQLDDGVYWKNLWLDLPPGLHPSFLNIRHSLALST